MSDFPLYAILGATGGIGSQLCRTLTAQGARLVVGARREEPLKTPLSSRIVDNEVSLKASTAMHPLGRIGEPQDVASLIAWLLGSDSSWITGQVWAVDGGLSRLKGRPTR